MECLNRRAILYLFVTSSIYMPTAECQNVLLEESRSSSQPHIMDSNREIVTSNSVSPKAQIMNTLLSIASGKKGFSEMPPTAPAMNQEKQYATMNQNQKPNICNVVSMSPQTSPFIPKEATSVSQPMITSTFLPQPAIPSNPISNIMMGTSFPSRYPTPYIGPCQPAVVPAASCSVPRPPRPPQVIPLDNYANMVQSYPTVWQIPPSTNDFYSYNSHAPVVYAEPTLNSPNWEICPQTSAVPAMNTASGTYDIITRSCNSDISIPEPVVVMSDCDQGLPFNVHINVPPPNMPAPRITLVSSAPASTAAKPDPYSSYSPFSYPPPLIMRSSRSSWKKMLPIILIALFSDQDSHGGCCCPCNCACDSNSPTPIPYPIPIPVNNPIINNAGSSSSWRRENSPNEDDYNEN